MADAVYNVLLDFTTQVNRKKGPVAKEVGKGMPQATKKMQEFQKFGSLTIPKGSIFDAESYSKVNKQFTNIAKTTSALNSEQIFGRTADVYKFGEGVQQVDTGLVQSTKSLKSMQGLFGELKQLHTFEGMGVNVDKLQIGLRQTANAAGVGAKEFEKMDHAALKMSKGFDMSKLSLLFFGMFLQKTFLGIFNKMLNSFKLIDKKGLQPLSRGLTKLQASFAFLGFSIIKALEPILLPIIDTLVSMIDWFSQLPVEVKQAIGITILALAALGTALLLVGIFGLGLPGLFTLIGDSMVGMKNMGAGTIKFLSNIGFALIGQGGLVGALVGGAVAIAGIIGWMYIFNDLLQNSGTYSEEFSRVMNASMGNVDKSLKTSRENVLRAERDWGRFTELLPLAFSIMVSSIVNLVALLVAGLHLGFKLIITDIKFVAEALGSLAKGDYLGAGNAFESFNKDNSKSTKEFFDAFEASVLNVGSHWDTLIDAQKDYNAETDVMIKNLKKVPKSGITIIDTSATGSTGNIDDDLASIVANQEKVYAGLQTGIDTASKNYISSLVGQKAAVTKAVDDAFLQPITNTIGYSSGSPPSEGALAKTPAFAENFVKGYSDSMTATAPYLNDTITTVFTDATLIMKNIVHLAVVDTINDVKLAIDALKRLDAKRAESRLSERSSSSTTNNSFNISSARGTDISRSIRNANIAVPTRL